MDDMNLDSTNKLKKIMKIEKIERSLDSEKTENSYMSSKAKTSKTILAEQTQTTEEQIQSVLMVDDMKQDCTDDISSVTKMENIESSLHIKTPEYRSIGQTFDSFLSEETENTEPHPGPSDDQSTKACKSNARGIVIEDNSDDSDFVLSDDGDADSDETSSESSYSNDESLSAPPPAKVPRRMYLVVPTCSSEWKKAEPGTRTENTFKFVPAKKVGVNLDLVSAASDDLDCFFALIDSSVVDSLVITINNYANHRTKLNTPARRRSMFRAWKPVTSYEIYKFLAVTTMMGLNSRPFMRDYWSTHQGLYTPWFTQMFQRERFEVLYHCFLHAFEVDAEDKCKIKPFIESLVTRFKKAFTPGQYLTVNEMIVGLNGKWAYKQINQSKPPKYNIKSFGLADSATGYVYNLLIYYDDVNASYNPSMDEDGGIAKKIFKQLLKNIGRGYHIFADRWYTSQLLLDFLQKKKMYFTGTLQVNRVGFPPEVKWLKMATMESKYWINDDNSLLCMAFKDKKAKRHINIVSNNAAAENTQEKHPNKPRIWNEYNQYMNSCGRTDQLLGHYGYHNQKSKEWWKKLFFWILEISTINAFILFKQTRSEDQRNSARFSLRNFKLNLVDRLTEYAASVIPEGEKCRISKSSRGRPCPLERLVGAKHVPMNVKKDRVCKHCRSGRTVYVCAGCDSNPHIHMDCFKAYHS
ncbi:piggyBac transposable element-derived protein 4 isoform X2 [Biomphalaria glabrata]|nr:piggyBac transposable element-derived protein 4 isoform X2 [Biomphalaria glabrata]